MFAAQLGFDVPKKNVVEISKMIFDEVDVGWLTDL